VVLAIFNKISAWKIYQGPNPVNDVKLPTIQNQRTRFLSHEEAARLLEFLRINPRIKNPAKRLNAKPTALHDLSLLSLHTGMRSGVCFALRGQDIDLPNGIITIRDPKKKTTRHAYMTEAVRAMLKRRKPKDPSALVFPDRKGNQAQQASQAFRRAVNKLKFNQGIKDSREKVTFNTLRHTFASWLSLQGETLQMVGELLGHKDLVMTKRYSHLVSDHKRRATVALEKGFEESKKNGAATTAT
jgi:integrase